jgi:hypothetical protein
MAKMDEVKRLQAEKVSPIEISRQFSISGSPDYHIFGELDPA